MLVTSSALSFAAISFATISFANMPMARADDGAKRACVTEHLEGQRLRDGGKLKAARQQFLACSMDACPAPLRKDCLQWLDETDAATPTVLIRARRADGQDTADVNVLVDGESITTRLTGLPLPIDPGEHVVRFVAGDGSTHEQRLVLNVGEKNRPVEVVFSARPERSSQPGQTPIAPSSPAPNGGGGIPASAYVAGAVGVVALGSFAFFGLSALTRGHDLESSCAPRCAGDDATSVRRDALIADVSLGVGIVALGAAAWILLTHHDSPASGLVVTPTPYGSVAGWRARF